VALSRLTKEGHGKLFHSVLFGSNFGHGGDRPSYKGRAVRAPAGTAWLFRTEHAIVFGTAPVRDEAEGLAAARGLESYGAVAMAIQRYQNKLAQDADEAPG
jgi:hypothetical protein